MSAGRTGAVHRDAPAGVPRVGPELGSPLLHRVRGVFHRAVSPAHAHAAIAGSRVAGRYSRAGQPTLYLSATPEGVAAAMLAHAQARAASPVVVKIEVDAPRVFDLRDAAAREAAGIDLTDALGEWRSVAAAGGTPASWRVRARVEALGATGLIDPSRKAPGLWHLVLFAWNTGGGARVRPLP